MDYFINQWASLGDPAKQVIILCGLTMLILFFVLTKLLSEYDKSTTLPIWIFLKYKLLTPNERVLAQSIVSLFKWFFCEG